MAIFEGSSRSYVCIVKLAPQKACCALLGGTELGQFFLRLWQELALRFGKQAALFNRLKRFDDGLEGAALIDPDLRPIPQPFGDAGLPQHVGWIALRELLRDDEGVAIGLGRGIALVLRLVDVAEFDQANEDAALPLRIGRIARGELV